jgi:hypothetical protein
VQDYPDRNVSTALITAVKHHADTLSVSRLPNGTHPDNATAIQASRAMYDLEKIAVLRPQF